MSELCVKIPGLDFERDLLSSYNRLFDLRKHRCIVVLPAPRRPMRCYAQTGPARHHPLTHKKDYPMKRHIQLKTIISLLSLLFAFSGAAFGQEVTGAITRSEEHTSELQ